MRTEGQGVVDVRGGWDAARKPGGLHIREREKPRRADRMPCPFGGRGRKGRRAHSQETRKGVNWAARARLGHSRVAKQRLTVTSPGGDRGRVDSPRCAALPPPRPPASRAERVTSGPLRAPPTRRRRLRSRRLRAGGPREALREPDAPGELTRGGRPPSSPAARRRRLSQGREEGAGAPASAARSSPAHGRAVCARSRGRRPPLLPGVADPAASQRPAARSTQLRPRREAARTGTNGGTQYTDPEAFPPQPSSRLEGARNPGSYFPAPVAAGRQAQASAAPGLWRS